MDEPPDTADRSPPRDPRVEQDLPDFGQLPVVTDLDRVTARVLAPNASPMTLDGTNTYVLGESGGGEAVIVDPGPDDDGHRNRVEEVLADRDAAAVLILVTHHHVDHAAGARSWAGRFSCPVAARRADVAGEGGIVLSPGEVLDRAGLRLEIVATPGHCADHLAFRIDTGALLTGDHVLGRGTSVVAHPDGDLAAYLTSLRRTLDLGPDVLHPGHGPALTEDVGAVLDYYLEHRRYRLDQIRAVLGARPRTLREIVEIVYADVDEGLWPAAEASTRAALALLVEDGEVSATGDRFTLVSDPPRHVSDPEDDP